MDEPLRRPPSFSAALAAAVAGFVGGGILTAIVAWPFALTSWTAFAVGSSGRPRALAGVVIAVAAIWIFQMLVSAWITQQVASLGENASVRFARALAAVVLGLLTTGLLAPALPAGAAVPILGRAWIGLLIVAFVVASAPASRASSRL